MSDLNKTAGILQRKGRAFPVPFDCALDCLLKIVSRRPSEQAQGLARGQSKMHCFARRGLFLFIVPSAGPMLENFLHQFQDSTLRAMAGPKIKGGRHILAWSQTGL